MLHPCSCIPHPVMTMSAMSRMVHPTMILMPAAVPAHRGVVMAFVGGVVH